MAAGLGFKTFNTGDVLSAADTNGYLMQGVLVFANATARDAAITSPQEGQFAFTKDNDSLWYYSGSAWVSSGATGDIEGVTAGTGISGGGTSGTVTVTNSMATAIDAKGDLIVGTGADTFARLGVGTNGHTIVADSAEATGLKWAAPAGGLTFAGCLLNNSVTSTTISNNTYTAITWNLETFDTDAFHSTTTNTSRITAPAGKGGYYQVNGIVQADNNTTGYRNIRIYKNGVDYKSVVVEASNDFPTLEINVIVNLSVGDYVEVFYLQNSGTSQTAYVGGADAQCYAYYLGA